MEAKKGHLYTFVNTHVILHFGLGLLNMKQQYVKGLQKLIIVETQHNLLSFHYY